MPRAIDPNTLAAIGGQQTATAASQFADTMMNLYSIKKQAEVQDLQKKQMRQEIQEWENNKELRAKQRSLSINKLNAEIELLPLQKRNAVQAEVNKSIDLKTQAFDGAMAQLANIKGAKSARKWKEEHRDLLRERFDNEEQFKAFMEQPYSEKWKKEALTDWRRWRPEMIDKSLEYQMQAELARAKSGDEDSVNLDIPSVSALADTFSDMGVDSDLRRPGALLVRDLMNAYENKQLPFKMDATFATQIVKQFSDEIDAENIGAPDNAAYEFAKKRDKFISDVKNGAGDAYVAKITGVPVSKIQELRQNNPAYTTQEIYEKILERKDKWLNRKPQEQTDQSSTGEQSPTMTSMSAL